MGVGEVAGLLRPVLLGLRSVPSLQPPRGNFLAVPTDCPQRDERLGWTGARTTQTGWRP
jgi:Bacterial alpha-L-rhamnosidase 6 hairpin glycosidase domain